MPAVDFKNNNERVKLHTTNDVDNIVGAIAVLREQRSLPLFETQPDHPYTIIFMVQNSRSRRVSSTLNPILK